MGACQEFPGYFYCQNFPDRVFFIVNGREGTGRHKVRGPLRLL
jgi:hypothetical protein